MLVLSRRLNEKILLPGIKTTIQIVSVKPGVVRLGIDAPKEVTVLREELRDRAAEWHDPSPAQKPAENTKNVVEVKIDQLTEQLRERLKTTGLGLGLLRLQMDAGSTEDAKAILAQIQDDFQILRYGLEGEVDQAPPKTAAPKPKKARRALLVEDDQNERELLAGFLRMSGLDVDTAGDGSDALNYLRSQGLPDVVLLDMGLPRVDGPTMVREIRRNPAYAGLKIFGVTGHMPDEFDLEKGPSGINGWFHKPLNPSIFLHDLAQELDPCPC